jgi:hypothetical protein
MARPDTVSRRCSSRSVLANVSVSGLAFLAPFFITDRAVADCDYCSQKAAESRQAAAQERFLSRGPQGGSHAEAARALEQAAESYDAEYRNCAAGIASLKVAQCKPGGAPNPGKTSGGAGVSLDTRAAQDALTAAGNARVASQLDALLRAQQRFVVDEAQALRKAEVKAMVTAAGSTNLEELPDEDPAGNQRPITKTMPAAPTKDEGLSLPSSPSTPEECFQNQFAEWFQGDTRPKHLLGARLDHAGADLAWAAPPAEAIARAENGREDDQSLVSEDLQPIADTFKWMATDSSGGGVAAAGELIARGATNEDSKKNIEESTKVTGGAMDRLTRVMDEFQSGAASDPTTLEQGLRELEANPLGWAAVLPGPLRTANEKISEARESIQSAITTGKSVAGHGSRVLSKLSEAMKPACRAFNSAIERLFGAIPEHFPGWDEYKP